MIAINFRLSLKNSAYQRFLSSDYLLQITNTRQYFHQKNLQFEKFDLWIPEHQELLTSGIIHKITLEPDH